MSDARVMHIRIAADRCQGHNRCCLVAPELFDSDDEGHGKVRGDGVVPEALKQKARLALVNCPEHAVRLIGV